MIKWFRKSPVRIARNEAWFPCSGLDLSHDGRRFSVVEVSLAGIAIVDPPHGLRAGDQVEITLHLPMAFGERSVSATVVPIEIGADRAVLVFATPAQEVLMSVRQFILGLRAAAIDGTAA